MSEVYVGNVSDFNEEDRKIVSFGDTEIGVFYRDQTFYAYENICSHQGGPVCEGMVIGKVEAVLDDDKRFLGERFSNKQKHLVCPWHGVEYDLETGQCSADPNLCLNKFEVLLRGDRVYVIDSTKE